MKCAKLGANVILLGRSTDKLSMVRDEIETAYVGARVKTIVADLASQSSVRQAGNELAAIAPVLDVLIHNAGAITARWTPSPEGIETTIAAQVLGPYLLTSLVLANLHRSSSGRVITMTSGGMYTQKFDLDSLELTSNNYDGVRAYARAKRAQVVLAHAWAQYDTSDVRFVTTHPGWTATPGLAQSLPWFYRLLRPLLRTTSQGNDTLLWLASEGSAPQNGGLYFDRRLRSEHKLKRTRSDNESGEASQLWEWCRANTGLVSK
jgi:NAD(P)-dependent dehydrogenase (short-subunit alcohol dehydrogenase family)